METNFFSPRRHGNYGPARPAFRYPFSQQFYEERGQGRPRTALVSLEKPGRVALVKEKRMDFLASALSFTARKAKFFLRIERPAAEPASMAIQCLDTVSAFIAEGHGIT
jgi:hypothetical protein